MVIGYIGSPTECTQTTIGAQEQGDTLLIISNQDELEATYTGTYIISCVERCEAFIDIADDEPMETIEVITKALEGFLRIPIEYLRQSMHPG
jgi:hypothetical protein